MKKEEIKHRIKDHQQAIKVHLETIDFHKEEIEKIQEQCPHDEGWEKGLYEWAPAHTTDGEFCNICKKFEPYWKKDIKIEFT